MRLLWRNRTARGCYGFSYTFRPQAYPGDRVTDLALSWETAKSLKDLGELTARWLEGADIEHPCYHGGGPDPETSPLVPDLVELNRSAFVTECSQPGQPMTNGSGQRAFVEGFCREDVARQVAALGLWTDLIVIAFPPEFEEERPIPVTIDNYRPNTWGGRHSSEVFKPYTQACGAEAVEELRSSWTVHVIDPQWGRDRYLWEYLADVVTRRKPTRFDIRPANKDLFGPGCIDFVF